jgi:outer membrane protein assembly factor BamB
MMTLLLLLALQDWPQYRGPNRDDVSTETGLLKTWPQGGPPLLWTYREAGLGYSGPAIVGDRLYTIGGRGETELLICLDKGKEAWARPVGPLFQFPANKWSAGPSATPTVVDGLIYALGGNGDLLCADLAGKERWKKNLPAEFEAQVNPIGGGPKNLGWGYTWSPVVDGERLILLPGGPKGTVAALDRKTGRLLWRSAEVKDQCAYASPMIAEIEGVRQVVALTNQGLFGVDVRDGRLLWRSKRDAPYGTEVVNTPLIQGAFIYTTVAVGNGGCELVKVGKDGAASVWANKNLSNHHGNVIRVGDHVYGHGGPRGWVCQKFMDGQNLWEEKRALGSGALAYADGMLYGYAENDGTVALFAADPAGWKESGRFQIPESSKSRKPSGKIWTPPVVAGGKLYLRDQELIFCYDVKRR